MKRFVLGCALTAGLVAAGLAVATGAQAQTGSASAVYVIHSAPAPEGERTAEKGQPLFTQTVTATRAAALDAETPTPGGFGKVKSFPAGTKMFGVRSGAGFAYCAVVGSTKRWWSGDELACFEDIDHDGAFDQVRPSGQPFLGVALFVFQLGSPRPLAAPVRYRILPYGDGPSIDFAVNWSAVFDKAKRGEASLPVLRGYQVEGALENRFGFQPIRGDSAFGRSTDGQTGGVDYRGAHVTFLGRTPTGGVRYRVDSTVPTQLSSVTMTVTTTTTYVPIYIR